MDIEIKTEKEFSDWFEKNFEKFGYDKILRKDVGVFPDFIMERNGKRIMVELETISSNFLLHNHDPKLVDEVICICKNIDLNVKVVEAAKYGLNFIGNKMRISASVEKETIEKIEELLKNKKYRNKSHVIEAAIASLRKEYE